MSKPGPTADNPTQQQPSGPAGKAPPSTPPAQQTQAQSTDPAGAPLALLNPDPRLLRETSDAVAAEVAERTASPTSLDDDGVRSKREDLIRIAASAAAHLSADAPPLLPVFLWLLQDAYLRLDGAVASQSRSVSWQQRYSGAALAEAEALHEVEAELRRQVVKRVGTSEQAQKARDAVGVGDPVVKTAPLDVHDLGVKQLAALTDPKMAAFLESKGLFPARKARELGERVARLKKELDAGVGPAPNRGDAGLEVKRALTLLEVVFERLVVFLQDFGAKEVAATLERRLPRKRRRGEREGEPGAGGGTGPSGG